MTAVTSISELNLQDENDMTCLFVPDLMTYGLGEEIVVEIGGLFTKTERIESVCQSLAEAVGMAVQKLYPDAKIECFVSLFHPKNGFWTSLKKPTTNDCSIHGSIEHMQAVNGKCPGCGKF